MKYLKNLIFKGNINRNVFKRELKKENIYDFPHLKDYIPNQDSFGA